jgi:hypothetical protein
MSATMFEPMLSKATIKAIDSVARKLGKAQRGAGNAVTRLFDHWNEMSDEEKQHVAGIMIATATTAATAIIAMRRATKSPAKSARKGIVKRLTAKKR